MKTTDSAPAWTDEADRTGRAAYLAAEQEQRDRRTPAERARDPLPEEQARLAELQASVDVAVGQVELAKTALRAALPQHIEARYPSAGGMLTLASAPVQ